MEHSHCLSRRSLFRLLVGDQRRRDGVASDRSRAARSGCHETHPLDRRGAAGGRARHAGSPSMSATTRSRAMPAPRSCGAFFEAGGRMIDSSPMYGSSQEVIGYGLPSSAPPRLFSADKVWISSGAARPGADREVAPPLGRAALRPAAGPQSPLLGGASADAARHEGGGRGALCRHHHLGGAPPRRVRARSCARIRSISCRSPTTSSIARSKSASCRWRASAASA